MKPTQEQVIAWARESGFEFNSLGATYTSGWLPDLLNSFATLAYEAGRKDENEACARVCEDLPAFDMDDPGSTAAAAIRERREQ